MDRVRKLRGGQSQLAPEAPRFDAFEGPYETPLRALDITLAEEEIRYVPFLHRDSPPQSSACVVTCAEGVLLKHALSCFPELEGDHQYLRLLDIQNFSLVQQVYHPVITSDVPSQSSESQKHHHKTAQPAVNTNKIQTPVNSIREILNICIGVKVPGRVGVPLALTWKPEWFPYTTEQLVTIKLHASAEVTIQDMENRRELRIPVIGEATAILRTIS